MVAVAAWRSLAILVQVSEPRNGTGIHSPAARQQGSAQQSIIAVGCPLCNARATSASSHCADSTTKSRWPLTGRLRSTRRSPRFSTRHVPTATGQFFNGHSQRQSINQSMVDSFTDVSTLSQEQLEPSEVAVGSEMCRRGKHAFSSDAV